SFFKSIPVAVILVHPSQSVVYAVASIVIVSPLLVSDDDSDSVVCSCSSTSTSTSTSTSSTCSSSCLGASCFGSSDSDVSASGFSASVSSASDVSASVSSASGASSTFVSSSTVASLFESDVSFSLGSSVSVDSFVSSCLGSSFTSLSFDSSDELDGCFSETSTINVSPGTTMVSERLFHSIKSSNDTLCANAISLNVSPALTVYVSPELAVISLAGFC